MQLVKILGKDFLVGALSGKMDSRTEWHHHAIELRRDDVTRPVIYIGTGTCGLGAGAGATLAAVIKYIADKNIDAEIIEVGCVGLCAVEPILDLQLPGKNRISFQHVTDDKVEAVLDAAFSNTVLQDHLLGQYRADNLVAWDNAAFIDQHPFFAPQTRWVLENCGIQNPQDLGEYVARGGYRGLYKALTTMSGADVCDEVEKSGLRGRGGGGFPTGKKWQFARVQQESQKYLVCNADEGDPGAFMDRAVIEGDPHRLLEGMVIAAYGIGASKAYIYIRAEYPLAIRRLEEAILQAEANNLLGNNILGTDFSLKIIIKMGAGAFVCGEETALIHSIEGKRGMPRPRPPFPAVKGVFGKPTIINNVETLANLPFLFRKGADYFASIGTAGSKGTKVFALSGKVSRTGLVEVKMGTTVRDIVFAIGGGVAHGKAH
ncbi:MAG: hypothetical protein FWH27_17315, partial [Planctomycetaceae bacterium]|nr:hypothetical protein [Planctomycetaceae bacterium]